MLPVYIGIIAGLSLSSLCITFLKRKERNKLKIDLESIKVSKYLNKKDK